MWGEALARHYADVHDVARIFELAIAAPAGVRFDVFFALSDNRWGYRDLEHARRVLGFEPLDRAEGHR